MFEQVAAPIRRGRMSSNTENREIKGMQLTRAMLDDATTHGVLDRQQAAALWNYLVGHSEETPSFKPAHILYYLGGLIAIGAMTLFMNLGWERFGGSGLTLISAGYCAFALGLTEYLLRRKQLSIPAGITAALAVVMVPLAVYGVQHMLGLWPSDDGMAYREYHTRIDWRWLMMELATLAAGAVALWRYRLPFLVLPIAVTLWYLSMDLTPFLFGGDGPHFYSEQHKFVSLWFGIAMTLIAFWVDLRSSHSKDFAFWLYIFGVLTFWGSLGILTADSNSELGKLLYCCINVLMIAIGAALSRRVFAVFGGLGIANYLGHLSYTVFNDSMLFPVALAAIGLAVIAAGVVWQRHEARLGEWLRAFLPAPLRNLVEIRTG